MGNQNGDSRRWQNAHQMSHQGSVVSLCIHPLGDYFISASDDGCWAFNNLLTGGVVQKVERNVKLTSLELHPDGRLLGTGDNQKVVKIWEIHAQNDIVTLPKFDYTITSVCFSQNGYHLAASAADGTVRVFDLRKTAMLHEFQSPGSAIQKVTYDFSGNYLACAGAKLRVYQSKTWETLAALTSHSKD